MNLRLVCLGLWAILLLEAQQSVGLPEIYELIQAGSYKQAERNISSQLAGNSRDPQLLTAMAYCRARQGDKSAAIELAGNALQVDPANAFARNILALNLIASGRLQDGIEELQTLLTIQPQNGAALRNLGLAYLRAGRSTEAIPVLEQRLMLHPDDHEVRIDLIGAYLSRGENESAAKMIDAIPNESSLIEQLCVVLNQREAYRATIEKIDNLGKREEALSANLKRLMAEAFVGVGRLGRTHKLLRSIPASSRNGDYFITLAWAHTSQAELALAVQTLQGAIAANPTNEKLYHALAMIFLRGAAPEDAVDTSKQGLARVPDSAPLLFSLGMAQDYLGLHTEAQQTLQESIEKDPSNGQAYYVLALSYTISGRWPEAERAFEKALERRPTDPLIKCTYATQAIKQRQWHRAEQLAREVEESADYVGCAHSVLGHAALAQGIFEEASSYLESAISNDPNQFAAAYRLALAYMRRGERNKAREYILQFQELKTLNEERENHRKILTRLSGF